MNKFKLFIYGIIIVIYSSIIGIILILGNLFNFIQKSLKINKNPDEFIVIYHTCKRMWRMTRNVFKLLWCPYCKTSKGFKIMK